MSMGWHSVGVRHEGDMQLAFDGAPLVPRIMSFAHAAQAKGPNIRVNSVHMRGSTLPFLVDLHVRATMMFTVWDELRTRDNLKDENDRGFGPLGVAVLNGQWSDVGTMLD